MTKDELQLRWDEILIQARFFCPDTSICLVGSMFGHTYGAEPHELGLLRAWRPLPDGTWFNQTVLRFMCGYLPKIANLCWKYTSKDWEKILGVVNRSNHDTRKVMVDMLTKHKERNNLRNTARAVTYRKQKGQKFHASFEAHKLSNQWAVCK